MNNPSTPAKWNHPFAALKHPNFRLYWLGMCVSLVGTWMQNVAQPWLAYELTKSPLLLSVVGALQFTPMLFLSLFAGVIIDRFPKRTLLLITQTSSLLITLALAILVRSGHVRYWHILVSAGLMGLVNTLDMPARQSFVIELAGREDLMNAIALNSSVFNIARVVGPALAGLAMGSFGIAFCFFANSFSFAAVIMSLLFIHPAPGAPKSRMHGRVLDDIRDGLLYIRRNGNLLRTLLMLAVVATFGMNFNVLVPVFAKEVLHQKEIGFGLLMSFVGIGSFVGAMLIATRSKSGPQKRVLRVFPFLCAGFLALVGFSGNYLLTGLFLAAAGFCFISFSSTANSSLQLNTADEYRGRVMSVYALVFGGSTPFGNLYSGFFSQHFGARAGFIACGAIIVVLAGMLLMLLARKKRVSD